MQTSDDGPWLCQMARRHKICDSSIHDKPSFWTWKTLRKAWSLVSMLGSIMSMDFMSQEHGVPRDGPKDSNVGGWTWEILDRNETRWRKPRVSNAQRTAERGTELYPGLGPSWWGKTPTSCLLVLQRDTSRGVQGLGYKALVGQRLKNLRAQLAAWRRRRFDQTAPL
jgi:hypothetical protein